MPPLLLLCHDEAVLGGSKWTDAWFNSACRSAQPTGRFIKLLLISYLMFSQISGRPSSQPSIFPLDTTGCNDAYNNCSSLTARLDPSIHRDCTDAGYISCSDYINALSDAPEECGGPHSEVFLISNIVKIDGCFIAVRN